MVNRHYPVCMQTAALPRREVSDLLMAMPSRGRFQLFYARRLENGQAKLSSSPRPLPQGHAYLVRQNPGVACMGVRLDAGSTWCYGIDWDCVQCNMHSKFYSGYMEHLSYMRESISSLQKAFAVTCFCQLAQESTTRHPPSACVSRLRNQP